MELDLLLILCATAIGMTSCVGKQKKGKSSVKIQCIFFFMRLATCIRWSQAIIQNKQQV